MNAHIESGFWRRRRWLVVIGAALLVVVFGALAGRLVGWSLTRLAPTAGASDAAAVYGIVLPDLAGTPMPLRTYAGKVLVVNFWATWCAPCREEMPALIRAQAEFAPKGLQIVGIGIDDVGKMRQFTQAIGVNYPTLDGGYGALELSKTLGNDVMALPFTVVVSRDGRVTQRKLGPLTDAELGAITAQLH